MAKKDKKDEQTEVKSYADTKSQLVSYVKTLRNHTSKPSIIKAIDNLLEAINADEKKEV